MRRDNSDEAVKEGKGEGTYCILCFMYGSKVSLLAFFSESVIDRLNVKLDVGSRDCKNIII